MASGAVMTRGVFTGLHTRPAEYPGLPYGEVARRIGVRSGALLALLEDGTVAGEQNGTGGWFLTPPQEATAVATCTELGLVTD